jgi:hypothetical protein
MDIFTHVVGLALAGAVGLVCLYLIFRLASYAILSSIEDIKQRRKKYDSKTDGK